MLSGVALLACGLLVFGRPLSTRQNLGAPLTLSTDIFSAPFSLASSPGTSSAFGLTFGEDAPGAPLSNQNAPVSLLSGQYAPVSPPSSLDASDKVWENSQHEAFPDMDFLGSNPNVEGPTPDSFPASQNIIEDSGDKSPLVDNLLLSQNISPLPSNFEQIMTELRFDKLLYCIFELAQDQSSLKARKCQSSGGKFKEDISRSSIGYILFQHDGKLFSIENLFHLCAQWDRDGNWSPQPNCESQVEQQRLEALFAPWRAGIDGSAVYSPSSVVYTNLDGLNDLAGKYNIPDFKNSI